MAFADSSVIGEFLESCSGAVKRGSSLTAVSRTQRGVSGDKVDGGEAVLVIEPPRQLGRFLQEGLLSHRSTTPAATCKASRVFPAPPTPVNVISRSRST